MPSYKLTYFPIRARAEVARQLFHIAGVPFEDVRLPMDQWPAHKAKAPFGQLPILEVDGKMIPQSYAIFRYLATAFGFAGKTPFEAAQVDALADLHRDYMEEGKAAFGALMGFAPGDTEKLIKEVAIPARDKYFTILEKYAKDNAKNGYFNGASITWVDLLIADFVETLTNFIPGHLAGFPAVIKTVQHINETPKLKEWRKTRPETKY